MPRLVTISALVLLTAGLSGCATYDYDPYDEDCGPRGGRIVYEEVEYSPPPHRYRSGHYHGRGAHRHARRHHGHDHHGYSHGHGGRRYSYDGPHGGYRGGRY